MTKTPLFPNFKRIVDYDYLLHRNVISLYEEAIKHFQLTDWKAVESHLFQRDSEKTHKVYRLASILQHEGFQSFKVMTLFFTDEHITLKLRQIREGHEKAFAFDKVSEDGVVTSIFRAQFNIVTSVENWRSSNNSPVSYNEEFSAKLSESFNGKEFVASAEPLYQETQSVMPIVPVANWAGDW